VAFKGRQLDHRLQRKIWVTDVPGNGKGDACSPSVMRLGSRRSKGCITVSALLYIVDTAIQALRHHAHGRGPDPELQIHEPVTRFPTPAKVGLDQQVELKVTEAQRACLALRCCMAGGRSASDMDAGSFHLQEFNVADRVYRTCARCRGCALDCRRCTS
jgi:hypothetical protein